MGPYAKTYGATVSREAKATSERRRHGAPSSVMFLAATVHCPPSLRWVNYCAVPIKWLDLSR